MEEKKYKYDSVLTKSGRLNWAAIEERRLAETTPEEEERRRQFVETFSRLYFYNHSNEKPE